MTKLLSALLLFGKRLLKFLFNKRTILLVTNQKIRSINIGPLPQFLTIGCMIWVGSLFIQSIKYDSIISSKSAEIEKLKSINQFFEQEFDLVNDKLQKVNEYLITNSGQKQNVSIKKNDKVKLPKNIDLEDLSKVNQKTINHIEKSHHKLSNINSFTDNRIEEIESALKITGLSSNRLLQGKLKEDRLASLNQTKNNPIGGPLEEDCILDDEVIASSSHHDFEYDFAKKNFSNKVDKLIFLENAIKKMPLSRPMNNYYISSSYGYRIDPMTKGRAMHRGLDFVGPHKQEILSPSPGRVILAGKYSDYGKAIVIDHGLGITTRYGHLSKIKVKKGDIVKRGDVIGLQGNTGRSTGAHLHYEVRYKNSSINPAKFIRAGDKILKENLNKPLYLES